MLQIDKRSDSVGIGLRAFPKNIIKPGAHYRLYIQARNIYATTGVEWGFTDQTNQLDYQGSASGIGSTLTELEVGMEMPVTIDPRSTKFIIECDNCYVKKVQFMMLPLYYRVTSKTVTDTATSPNSSYSYAYAYNDGAVNDLVHSVVQNRTGTKYTPTMREYRGYSQVRVTNPDGLATTTWYYQNDELYGRPYRTLTSTMDFSDEFSSLKTTKWNFSHANTRQMIESNQAGESWLKSSNPNADWITVTNRIADSLSDGDVVYTQFKVTGSATRAKLGVENESGSLFGVKAYPNGSSHDLFLEENGSSTLLQGIGFTFKRDTWFELMIFLDDDDNFQLRVWEKYNPANFITASASIAGTPTAWHFTDKVYNGTVLMDSYAEGVPYSETETSYTSAVLYDTITNTIPNLTALTNFVDLQVTWSYTSEHISRLFDGDYSFSGTRTTYGYKKADQGGTQYGNLTRSTDSYWDGIQWVDYRATKTVFNPNPNAYLTRHPARSLTLDCTSACDFDTETSKTGEVLYLYDGATLFSTPPTAGKLTATRAWAGGADFSQVSYGYDAYGNITSQTTYTGYGTATTAPTSGALTTTTAYDNDYHTYATSTTNTLNQTTEMAYDYTLGVPTSITDANGAVTEATYDAFGRMLSVIAPGDSTNSPTLTITYYDTRIPFQVDLQQKVNDSSASIRISHFYNGLGAEIQTQTVGVVVNGSQVNSVVSTIYDMLGRKSKVTVPYTTAYDASPEYISSSVIDPLTKPKTEYAYDDFGRQESVTAPNGNVTNYAYNGLTTSVADALNQVTTTANDPWGRVISVDEPTGPNLSYTYDTRDQLLTAQKGTGSTATLTSITYDVAGNKVAMDDPDMGDWTYTYDALGNLLTQTDARDCATSMSYDELNRLTQKSYSGSGACGSTPTVNYYFDTQSFSFLGDNYGGGSNLIGRLSGMVDGSGATMYTYDTRGRTTSETRKIYQDSGKTSAETFTTAWTYNSADLPVTMTLDDGEVLTYGYDSAGNLLSLVNGSGFIYLASMRYDEAGRTTQMNLGSGSLLQKSFTYAAWNTSISGGKLTGMSTVNSANATLQNLGYTYDAVGNITQISDGVAAETSAFTYDALNRLTAMNVTSGGSTVNSESFTFDATNGNLASKNSESYTYSSTHPHAAVALGTNTYAYDANGNQTTRVVDGVTYLLTFDAANKLISVQADAPFPPPAQTPTATGTPTETPTETATPTENETPTEPPTPTETLAPTETATATETPTPTPTPTEIATPDGATTPEETPTPTATLIPTDTETPTPTPTATLSETPEETATETPTPSPTPLDTATPTPTATAQPVNGSAQYFYDGNGNMVKSIIGEVVTYYPNASYELRVEGTSETELKYYLTGSVRIAMRENEAITWLLSDHLGSTSVTVDASGSLLSSLKFTAYGELRSGSSTTDYQYTGQRNEVEIGLYYYVARFYDPQLARFVSADIIIPQPGSSQGYDRYAYTHNNPINYNDPTGHRMDDGCLIDGCKGNRNLIIHSLYLGGFPFVLIPTDPQNYSQKAEETYSTNEDKVNAILGAAGLGADALEQGLYYRRSHRANDVDAFISFNELEDGSISITSLTVWNNTDWIINVDTISINSAHTGTELIIGPVEGYYSVNPPRITVQGSRGVANADPESRSTMSLTPSNPNNPINIFSQNHHIDIVASFRAVNFDYNLLSIEWLSFDW